MIQDPLALWDLPEGWKLTHLIFLDPSWQCNLRNEHHVVVATGNGPHEAIEEALGKVEREDYCGTLWRPQEDLLKVPKIDPKNLLENLGLAKPLSIPRRNGL